MLGGVRLTYLPAGAPVPNDEFIIAARYSARSSSMPVTRSSPQIAVADFVNTSSIGSARCAEADFSLYVLEFIDQSPPAGLA